MSTYPSHVYQLSHHSSGPHSFIGYLPAISCLSPLGNVTFRLHYAQASTAQRPLHHLKHTGKVANLLSKKGHDDIENDKPIWCSSQWCYVMTQNHKAVVLGKGLNEFHQQIVDAEPRNPMGWQHPVPPLRCWWVPPLFIDMALGPKEIKASKKWNKYSILATKNWNIFLLTWIRPLKIGRNPWKIHLHPPSYTPIFGDGHGGTVRHQRCRWCLRHASIRTSSSRRWPRNLPGRPQAQFCVRSVDWEDNTVDEFLHVDIVVLLWWLMNPTINHWWSGWLDYD